MTLTELARAGRSPGLPCELQLAGQRVTLLTWLRVLPGQRYVARGECDGRPVLAKLMVGGRAERHFQREREGVRHLLDQALPTPALVAEGFQEGQGGWLLFDYLEGARSLWDEWQPLAAQPPLSEAQQQLLGEALGLIAALHARGLWQGDLHLDNLLRQAGQLWLVDGGGVRAEQPGRPLSRQRVLENLGLFFAQLPSRFDAYIEESLVFYLLANSEHALPLEALLREVRKARGGRLQAFLGKLGRDCTAFAVPADPRGLQVVRREEREALAPLLADPERFMDAGEWLKRGGSASVCRVEVEGRPLVVKRYNIKGVGHFLRRCLRPSRAWHSWLQGNRLAFLDIATPQPLAVLERRTLGLRHGGYLVTEYLPGEDIISRFASHAPQLPPETEVQALVTLFDDLHREGIVHGDLKGTNLLWRDGRWALIDLDALRRCAPGAAFEQAHARDRQRLLRNWPVDSPLYRLLDERLPKGSLEPSA